MLSAWKATECVEDVDLSVYFHGSHGTCFKQMSVPWEAEQQFTIVASGIECRDGRNSSRNQSMVRDGNCQAQLEIFL